MLQKEIKYQGKCWEGKKHSVNFVAIYHHLMALEEEAKESDEDGKSAREK